MHISMQNFAYKWETRDRFYIISFYDTLFTEFLPNNFMWNLQFHEFFKKVNKLGKVDIKRRL